MGFVVSQVFNNVNTPTTFNITFLEFNNKIKTKITTLRT